MERLVSFRKECHDLGHATKFSAWIVCCPYCGSENVMYGESHHNSQLCDHFVTADEDGYTYFASLSEAG